MGSSLLNLLLINYEFPPLGAGAATATWQMGKAFVNLGHEVTILTSGYKKEFGFSVEEGMRVFRCPTLRKRLSQSNLVEMLLFVMSAFFFLPWIGVRQKIDRVVVFFLFPCGPLGLWAKMIFKIPYVISLRGGDVPGNEERLNRIHRLLSPVRRFLYRQSLAVTANSEGLNQLARKTDPDVDILTVPNGGDTSFFRPATGRAGQLPVTLIFVGRLSDQKNLFFLIEHLGRLRTEVPFVLDMVGDGPIKTRLQEFAGEMGLTNAVTWHGWLKKEDIRTLLQNSDCLINPSFCEGMPNAVLEAMACGIPVIASNVPGNQSLIRENQNGVLFDLDDPEGFHHKLEEMIEKTAQGTLPWNCAAIHRMAENYSWEGTAVKYAGLFTDN